MIRPVVPALRPFMALVAGALLCHSAQASIWGKKSENSHGDDAHTLVVFDGVLRPSNHFPDAASGFFSIRNNTQNDQLLQEISSPLCREIIAIHTNQGLTPSTEDLFRHLTIPHGATMVFPIAGYHLRCLGIQHMPRRDEEIPFTFAFLGGQKLTVQFRMADRSELEKERASGDD